MSTSYILIAFTLCIILMIVLITKCKIHPVLSILMTSIILAIALQTPWKSIEGEINAGFSGTIKSVAIIIVLGCFLGKVMEETGAALKITQSIVDKFGEKNVIWAIAVSSFILGIAIWADSVVILAIPIVSMLAVKTNKSMMSFGTALYLGALVTASLVPPTPGPVSAAALLEVPLGQAILWGAIVSIPSVAAATLYCMTLKTPVYPKEEYLKAAKEAANSRVLPSLFNSLAPILLALTLIVINTVLSSAMPGTSIANFFAFVGSPLAALLAACLYSLVLTGKDWKSEKVLNGWFNSAVLDAAVPIVVTGMGGALATFVKSSGAADAIAEVVINASIPGIVIPIVIAAVIHIVTGSNSLAVMTAAALVQPMLETIGVSPLAAFLACGTGALMFKHANSSGFWVTVTMSNMDVKQGIRGVGIASTIAGGVGAIITVLLSTVGII
ncbi:MAG: GntP family permease [Anaerotignaceae bacterium]